MNLKEWIDSIKPEEITDTTALSATESQLEQTLDTINKTIAEKPQCRAYALTRKKIVTDKIKQVKAILASRQQKLF